MRSVVGSCVVVVAVVSAIAGPPGRAWGEEAAGLEPPVPAQTGVAALDLPAVSSASPTVPTPVGSLARSANPLWDVPMSSLSATRDRPLFSASRRPPPVAAPVMVTQAPPPPPKEPERPNLQLVGTVIGDDESFGIFVDAPSQTSLRLRVGASHEGWVLQSLRPREALLQKAPETVTLLMPQLGADVRAALVAAPAPQGGRDRAARRAR